jgi:hypothetical protein
MLEKGTLNVIFLEKNLTKTNTSSGFLAVFWVGFLLPTLALYIRFFTISE